MHSSTSLAHSAVYVLLLHAHCALNTLNKQHLLDLVSWRLELHRKTAAFPQSYLGTPAVGPSTPMHTLGAIKQVPEIPSGRLPRLEQQSHPIWPYVLRFSSFTCWQ